MRIDIDKLEKNAERGAECLNDMLGNRLSSFLLERSATDRLGLSPKLPTGPGAAWAIFVWRREFQNLARSFLLPLRWKKGISDLERLPQDLSKVADGIREKLNQQSWGLCLGDGVNDDLSALDFEAESSWAPLAAALLVAAYGGRPDHTVFSTGAWRQDGGGVRAVEDVELKLGAVAEYVKRAAPGKKGTLFVPAGNYEKADHEARKNDLPVEVISYPAAEADAHRVLAEHAAMLDVPPPAKAPLDEKLHWANRRHIVAEGRRRVGYYWDNLVEPLGGRLPLPDGLAAGECLLALLVGYSAELCAMLLAATRPAEALLVHTGETEARAARVQRVARRLGVDVGLMPYRAPEDLVEELAGWLGRDARRAWVDVTGGTKEMSLAAAASARRAGARVCYLAHEMESEHRRQLYGTERLVELGWV